METFPESFELIEFFAAEPELADPGVDWIYNTLTFRIELQGEELRIEIQPANGNLEAVWIRAGKVSLALTLNRISDFAIARDGTVFRATSPQGLFELEMRPDLKLRWASEEKAV